MGYRTVGEACDMSIARAEAEMRAGRLGLSRICSEMPNDYNPLQEMQQHLIEAVDALMVAAGSFGGIERKRAVLIEAARRHGIELR